MTRCGEKIWTRGEIRSELAIWAEGTQWTTAELFCMYDDYCTKQKESGDETLCPGRWADEVVGIPN